MFCQSQAYPTENKPEKSGFFRLFYFQKKLKVFKKARISKSGFKKQNCQPCYIRIENAYKVRKKTFNFLLYIEVQKT